MARLWQSGFELNSTTASVELTSVTGTIVSSIIRSGSYSGRRNVQRLNYDYASSALQDGFFIRSYIFIETLPSSDQHLIRMLGPGLSGIKVDIRINSSGALELWNNEDSVQVGSDSSALSTRVWYLIELKVDTTTLASTTIDARINGSSFASGTINLTAGIGAINLVGQNASGEVIYHDDVAINDDSGSFQNSWPGQGKIIHLRPNAAGDNTAWTGAYTDVDEVTPDDTTTKLSSNTLDQIEDMNIDSPTMMGDQDTVNVVAVGVRFNGVGASANASFVLRIKASASGTVEESSAITPSNTTYVTNAAAAPRNYSLVLYDLPGASTTAWTKNDLEQAQIGVRLSATSTNAAQVSTIWASVDYTPVFGPMKQKPRNPKINWRI